MTAIVSGQADVAANTPSVITAMADKRKLELKFVMAKFPYAIGLAKEQPEFKASLDGWVATNLKNGKLNAIYKKYHGVDLPASMLE